MKTLTGMFESSTQAEDAVRALQDAGIASEDISIEDAGGGGTLVTARVGDAQLDLAAAIMNQSGFVDVDERPAENEESGRSTFDDPADPRSYRREDEPDGTVIVPPLPH